MRAQSEGSGDSGALMLGTVQIRPNSERLLVDGVPLTRGTDYSVDYDLGRVSFNRPDTLFPRARQVTVQYEENPVFEETPTSIFGATAELPFENGQINFTAISQSQRTNFTRPPLGFEPAASLVGGVTALFNFEAEPLTQLVSKLPYGPTTVPSKIGFSAEVAGSRPQTNASQQAYLESFEGEGGLPIVRRLRARPRDPWPPPRSRASGASLLATPRSSARSLSEMIGRVGPFKRATEASLLMPTTKASPNSRAF